MTNQAIVKKDFGGIQTQSHAETAALAVAAQAKAAIEARWLVATHQPRNIETVRQELLKECQRPSFAKAARYKKPIGQGIEGLSIRFVEAALQVMGNIDVEAVTTYDDAEKRIVAVTVTDFQKNITYRKQVTVNKTVERKFLRKGQTPLSSRTNSAGETTYLIQASEDDLLNKEGALVSKAIRTGGLRIIPGWLQDEATDIIKATARDEAARDPDAEKRKLLDGFGQIGVTPAELESYLGHPVAQIVPAELVDLRAVWEAISEGETTWAATLAHRQEMRGLDREIGEKTAEAAKAKPATKGTQGVKDALKSKAKPAAAPKREAPKLERDEPTATMQDESETAKPAPVSSKTLPAEHAAKAEEQAEAKRPSRSKAAQEERKIEIKGLGHVPGKYATLYIQHGDPRNLAKATDAMEERIAAEVAEATAGRNVSPDGTVHDANTGEVVSEAPSTDEPDWMTEKPKGEAF